jgi:hypothetical protein
MYGGVTRGAQVTGIVMCSLSLTWISTILRFYVRISILKFVGREDWLTIAAMVNMARLSPKKFALSMLNRFPSPFFAPSVCWMSIMDLGHTWRILMLGSNRLVSRLASTFRIRGPPLTRCRSSSFANCSTSSPQLSPNSQSLPISFAFPSRSTKESSSSPPFQWS